MSEKTLPTTLDADLRADMLRQTSAFVDAVFITQSGSFTSLLTSRRQPLTARLALHYGLPAPTGDNLQFVDTAPNVAAGALSEGLFLSSYPRPTLRGRAIVEGLQCQRVPEHPAVVDSALGSEGTPRQRIEQTTSANPACLSCHDLVDPIGFALEAFDDQGRLTGFNTTSVLPSSVQGYPITVISPHELGSVIAGSSAGRACAAKHYLETAFDHEIVESITAKVVLPPGSQGAPLRPAPFIDPEHEWIGCLVQNAGTGDFNLTAAAELIVAGTWLGRRVGAPHHFAAFDTSLDPVEHAYQEAAQFGDAFPDGADNQTIRRYMDGLLGLKQLDRLPRDPPGDGRGGGAGGETTSAPGASGAP